MDRLTLPPGHVPRMRYRLLRRDDLAESLSLLPAHLGLSPEQRDAAARLWVRLLDEPAVITGIMEDVARPAGERIQAWGVTIVLPPEFVRDEALATAPRAFVGRRVYEGLLSGRFRLLDDREIGAANVRGDLELLILHYSMRHSDLTHPYVHQVLALANDTFRVFHSGYHIRALHYENDAPAESFALQSGFVRRSLLDEADLASLPPQQRPMLYGLTRDEAVRRLPGTPARNCFEHARPRFRFSANQRRLLWLSLFDEPDDRLMAALDVSAHGLKKLWRNIYERIEDVEPDFFGDARGGAADDEGKRGPEKRRQVLAYVRQRLEEVRPWTP